MEPAPSRAKSPPSAPEHRIFAAPGHAATATLNPLGPLCLAKNSNKFWPPPHEPLGSSQTCCFHLRLHSFTPPRLLLSLLLLLLLLLLLGTYLPYLSYLPHQEKQRTIGL